MKGTNFAIWVALVVFSVVVVSITLARPTWLAGYAGLLSPSGWRVAKTLALLIFAGCFALAMIQQAAAKRSRRS